MRISEPILKSLRQIADNECFNDQPELDDLVDYLGTNNLNDVYNVGYNDGQVMLARRLLDELKVK